MQPALVDRCRQDIWPRSSDEVEREAMMAFHLEPHVRPEAVTCRFHEGTLMLRGQVTCYYHKQLAQSVVTGIAGVERVVNRLVVSDPASAGE